MPTIYTKYRPQKFSDFFGQEHLIATLTSEIKNNKIAHAYIFSGPRGTGKTTLARLFAKAINCQKRPDNDFEPCGECSSCQEISQSRNIDVMEMDAASHTGVENVRENIIDNAQFKPTGSPYKVFIIDEVHMLSGSAFNALLKTLEEPPAHVIFILATTEWHKLPATIVSRCQRFIFKKIPRDIIKKKLKNIAKQEDIKIDDDVWEKIISKADGCLRDAESLLGQLMSLGLEKITAIDAEMVLPAGNEEMVLDFIKALAEKDSQTAMGVIKQSIGNGINPEEIMAEIVGVLREIMIAKNDVEHLNQLNLSDESKKKIRTILDKLDNIQSVRLLELAIKRNSEIKHAPIPQLPLEIFVAEVCGDIPQEKNDDDKPVDPPPPVNISEENSETTPPPDPVAAKTSTPKIDIPESKDEEPVEKINDKNLPEITMAEARENWDNFIKAVNEKCPSLIFLLNMAKLKDTHGHAIELSVEFDFHREKLEQPASRQAIEDAWQKTTGKKAAFKYVVEASQTPKDEVDDLAAQFGGEVM